MPEYVDCFDSEGNFGDKSLSFLNALLVLLISSVFLVLQLDFDGVTVLLGMIYFSLVRRQPVYDLYSPHCKMI